MDTALGRLLTARAERRYSLEQGNVPLTAGSLLLTLLGGGQDTDAGVSVNTETALGLTPVWRAVTLLSGLVGSLELAAIRKSDGDRRPAPLFENPHPLYTPFEFQELLVAHLATQGNAYVLKGRDAVGGQVVRLLPLRPENVKPKLVIADGNRFPTERVFVVKLSNGEELGAVTEEDLLHIPGFGYDGVAGLSPIGKARNALGLSRAVEKYGSKLFANGALKSGLLKTEETLEPSEARRLKRQWQEQMGGLDNAHEIGVLDAGADFMPLSIPPEDAQFLETRNFSVQEVARLFGVPPHLLMTDRASTWGAGIEQQNIGLILFTLKGGYLARIEQRMGRLLPRTQRAEFQVDPLLKGDTRARYAAYLTARKGLWMSINEVRRKEGLAELEAEEADDPTWAAPAPDVTLPGGNEGEPPPPGDGEG